MVMWLNILGSVVLLCSVLEVVLLLLLLLCMSRSRGDEGLSEGR